MCYNLEVSLSTGIFSYLSGYLVLQRELTNNEYHCVLFFLLFSTVQFADSLLWISEMKKNMLNYITTSFIIPALLSSQIFFNIYVFNKIRNPLILFFMVLYILDDTFLNKNRRRPHDAKHRGYDIIVLLYYYIIMKFISS